MIQYSREELLECRDNAYRYSQQQIFQMKMGLLMRKPPTPPKKRYQEQGTSPYFTIDGCCMFGPEHLPIEKPPTLPSKQQRDRDKESSAFTTIGGDCVHRDVLRLQQCLELPTGEKNDKYTDVLFIAIDFENVLRIEPDFLEPDLRCQFGISIFDTRDEHPTLKTYNYITGLDEAYHTRAGDRYLFGDSTVTEQWLFPGILESFMDRDRNIVIVGHGMNMADMRVLDFLEIDLKTSVVGIFDTFDMCPLVLGPG
jgi:hypothetical protein